MTFDELTENQLNELAQRYLIELDNDGKLHDETGLDSIGYADLAEAEYIIGIDRLREEFDSYDFSPDDFFCLIEM